MAKHLLTPDQFNSLLYYISQEGESKNFEQFYSTLAEALPHYREDIMTLAQQLEQKGLARGFEQGKHAEALIIAKKMLNRGDDYDSIKDITGLSDQDLLSLED